MRIEQLLEELERLTRNGQHNRVRLLLKEKWLKATPREYKARISEILFRINEPLQALKVLKPLDNPEIGKSTASKKEKMIYATSLFSIGAVNEADALLSTLDARETPEVLFYRALSC